jgi:hypothetical protein
MLELGQLFVTNYPLDFDTDTRRCSGGELSVQRTIMWIRLRNMNARNRPVKVV